MGPLGPIGAHWPAQRAAPNAKTGGLRPAALDDLECGAQRRHLRADRIGGHRRCPRIVLHGAIDPHDPVIFDGVAVVQLTADPGLKEARDVKIVVEAGEGITSSIHLAMSRLSLSVAVGKNCCVLTPP